ncbi:hypothetical protein B0H14DRAFT_3475339 [Mycena olivaceomarginata]|nr:hypothetical protein B0H14DRAFT_3475339 [Mycena olivaceomarginata]
MNFSRRTPGSIAIPIRVTLSTALRPHFKCCAGGLGGGASTLACPRPPTHSLGQTYKGAEFGSHVHGCSNGRNTTLLVSLSAAPTARKDTRPAAGSLIAVVLPFPAEVEEYALDNIGASTHQARPWDLHTDFNIVRSVNKSSEGKWTALACHELGSLVVQHLEVKDGLMDELLGQGGSVFGDVARSQWGSYSIRRTMTKD